MILMDTGPFVALFDPRDHHHARCKDLLKSLRDSLCTTVPVLTEALHLLTPASIGAARLREFVMDGGAAVWCLDDDGIRRAFELMEQYADHPMDLADASLIVAAESLDTTKVFTIDRPDFTAYRIRRGHRHLKVELIG
jgi:hypothetical protein